MWCRIANVDKITPRTAARREGVGWAKGNWRSDRHSQDRHGGSLVVTLALDDGFSGCSVLCSFLWALMHRQKARQPKSRSPRLHCCRRLPGLGSHSSSFLQATCLRLLSRDAITSPKTRNEEFLIGPVNRRGITQNVNNTLDDPSNVLRAGVAIEVSLGARWLDPQIEHRNSGTGKKTTLRNETATSEMTAERELSNIST